MNGLDWILLGLVALMALQGWRAGFIGGVFSLVGFVAGALLAARFVPSLLPDGKASPYAPLAALAGAACGGAILASIFEAVGGRLRRLIPLPFLGKIDGVFGLVLGAVLALGGVWLLGVVLIKVPAASGLRGEVRSSKLLAAMNQVLPPGDQVLGAIAAFDPLPLIGGPATDGVAAPPTSLAADPGVAQARSKVVRIRASACGFSVEGSGWISSSGFVVTNAHVVAGDSSPSVELSDRVRTIRGHVVVFDSHNDIAVVSLGQGGGSGLSLGSDSTYGSPAAILGYPLDGPFNAAPARLGATVESITDDAYGNGPVRRLIVVIRGKIRPGNSGGPVVSANGSVIAMVYARTSGNGPAGGYGIPPSEIRKALLRAESGAAQAACPCQR